MKRWVVAAVAGITLLVVGWQQRESIGLLAQQGSVEEWIRSLGPIGPIATIVLIAIVPIPGQVTGMAAGAVYGYELGAVLMVIGGTLGSCGAITVGRLFGKTLAARFTDSAMIQYIATFKRIQNPLLWAIVFLPPLGDAVSFAAGLTSVALPRLFLGAFLGRLPQYALMPVVGSIAQSAGPAGWLVGLGVAVVLSVLMVVYSDALKRQATALIHRFEK